MQVEKKEHPMWRQWFDHIKDNPVLPERLRARPLIHKDWYIYTNKRGRISLIELGHPYDDDPLFGGYNWEICGGGFTEDVERFPSKEAAERRIRQLLLPSSRWCFYNERKSE